MTNPVASTIEPQMMLANRSDIVRPARIELRDIGKRREGWLEHGVVEARAAMQQQHGRPLAHTVTVRRELLADHVEEQARAVDRDIHKSSPLDHVRRPLASLSKISGEEVVAMRWNAMRRCFECAAAKTQPEDLQTGWCRTSFHRA